MRIFQNVKLLANSVGNAVMYGHIVHIVIYVNTCIYSNCIFLISIVNKEWIAEEYIGYYTAEKMHWQGALYLFFLVDDNQDQKVVPSEVDALFNQLDMDGNEVAK